MIRNLFTLFAPEQLQGNYLIPTTVVSITIEHNKIIATVILLKGTTVTVQKIISEPLEETKSNFSLKITQALAILIKKVGHYDKVITCLPSSLVMFKRFSFPFVDPDKIKMVLAYELEGQLPFSTQDACIDFIITQEHTDPITADVIIAAAQKKLIEEFLKPFHDAGITIANLTVDAIGLYNLIMRQKETISLINTVMIDLQYETTKLLFFAHNQLQYIRTLRSGLMVKTDELLPALNFTLQSCINEQAPTQPLQVILIDAGQGTQLTQLQNKIGFTSEIMNLEKLLKNKITIPELIKVESLTSLTIAIPFEKGRDFNLQEAITPEQKRLIDYQTVTALFFSISTVILLGAHTFLQIRKLSAELIDSQNEVMNSLKENFPAITTKNRQDALNLAAREVQNESKIWSSFASETRKSFLEYFHDLSTKIDRETLGLNLKKMLINKNTITLEGNVRSFEAVEQFEAQLKETKLFSNVPDLQKVEFSVILPLDSQGAL